MQDEIALIRLLHPHAEVDAAVLVREKQRLEALIHGAIQVKAQPYVVPQRVVPHLIYEDVVGAIDWLQRAFGFREREENRYLEPDGSICHAEVQIGEAVITLGPPSIHGDSPRQGVSSMIYVYVGNVDRHCERARSAGAIIVIEPEDVPWGDRRYQATDPEGHRWQFAQRIR